MKSDEPIGERASSSRVALERGHWAELARRWDLTGPPLRVAPEDLRAYADAIQEARLALGRGLRVLLLGVTPELYRMPWPAGSELVAVDRSQAMIELVWPGPRDAVRCADWTALPLPDASRDVALCDGGVHLLAHPEGQARLVRSLRRVLAPGALCVLRLFVPPKDPEATDDVLRDLHAGRIASANVLKLRLGMALQRGPGEGVRLADVWHAFQRATPDPAELAARIGWPLEQVLSLDTYRDSADAYHFVTRDQVAELFCRDPGGFQVESLRVPSYVLGERCPVLALRRE